MDNHLLKSYKKILADLEKAGLIRTLRDRESPQGRTIRFGGVDYINFSSNDYLGLAAGKIPTASERMVILQGGGASRLLGGGTAIYRELEGEISRWKGSQESLVLTSGYATNVGVIPALTDTETLILSDELNHASIIDGIRLSRAEKKVYRHCDMNHLEELLRRSKKKKIFIITESVFSMDGDIAPLSDLIELGRRFGAMFYIDDAHGSGVIGEGGGGLSHFGIKWDEDIVIMGTLSKAVGSLGGFISSTETVRDILINRCRSFIYTTALPEEVLLKSLNSIQTIKKHPELITTLWEKRNSLFSKLKGLGLDTGRSETPIIPVIIKDNEKAISLSRFLFEHGIYAPAIRYPTVNIPRLRITVTANHEEGDILYLINTLKEALSKGLL
ncbi:MAG: 8-amino-7-oxononanoate synthase [Nitrospirae bacterium]|nr:MAG: 8-amino-7-oxononanoate synthase [Nitrospirota bacterium]